MKVLFVTLFPLENNTSVTISNYGILSGLQKIGHEVTILMPYASDKEVTMPYDLSMFRIVRIEGIPFDQLRNVPQRQSIWYKVRRKYRKMFEFLDFTRPYLKSAKNVSILNEHFDLIISTSDPKTSHVFVRKMIKNGLKYDRWIQHWGDPMYGDITRSNSYPNWIVKLYERNIIKMADKIVYVSPFTADMLRKVHSSLNNKISFVPLPCIDTNYTEQVENKEKAILKLVYLGDYSPSIRNIIPLYEAVKQMNNVELTIAGISTLKLENTDNITVLPRISQDECLKLENEADVLVTVCNLHGTQIPGKLYYSAASQKHMLVIIDGNNKNKIKAYINSFNRYLVCDNMPESIVDMLSKKEVINNIQYNVPSILKPQNNINAILE